MFIDELQEEISELRSRVAELEASRRWIPVSERLPEPLVPVLAFPDEGGGVSFAMLFRDGLFSEAHNDGEVIPVTHWQPLPEPPK